MIMATPTARTMPDGMAPFRVVVRSMLPAEWLQEDPTATAEWARRLNLRQRDVEIRVAVSMPQTPLAMCYLRWLESGGGDVEPQDADVAVMVENAAGRRQQNSAAPQRRHQ